MIIITEPERETSRDRRRRVREAILDALTDAGRALTPAEITDRTGLGTCVISIEVAKSPAYFAVERDGKRVVRVDRHRHLKAEAWQ